MCIVLKIKMLSVKGKISLFWDGNWWLSLNLAMFLAPIGNSGCLDNQQGFVTRIRIDIFSRKKYQSLIVYIKPNAIYLTFRWFYRMRLLWIYRKKYHRSIINNGNVCKRLVNGSAFIPCIIKKSSNSWLNKCCYCFFHRSGSMSLYFSNGVFGCHSMVFSMTSLMYSNRLMPFNLHEIAIEYRIAPRLAPSCEPKNNEFLLDNDMYLWILSM